MKKVTFLYCFFISVLSNSQAPFFDWAMQAPITHIGHVFVFDVSNNMFCTGGFSGTFDFDRGPGVYTLAATTPTTNDVCVAKYDPLGNIIWAKKFGSTQNDWSMSISLDAGGNIFTCGNFTGIVDFDPGPGTSTLASQGTTDVYVSKWDASGNFLWSKCFGGIGTEYVFDLISDASGNTYVTGQFNNTVDFDPGPGVFNLTPIGIQDLFVVKLDPSGNLIWVENIGGNNGISPEAINLDPSLNIIIGGEYYATSIDFDPGPGVFNLSSVGNSDNFILKLSNSGSFIWAKSFGGLFTDYIHSLRCDATGNIVAVGTFSNATVDFDPGSGTFNLTSLGGYDAFIEKLDPLGNFVFAKQIGNTNQDVAYAMDFDASSNIYVGGSFQGNVDFDPGPGVLTYSSTNLNGDIFLGKYDINGNVVWVKVLGGTQSDQANCIAIDLNSNIYSNGTYWSTVDFDPGPGTYTMTAPSINSPYVLKLCQNSCLLDISENVFEMNYDIYPNPNSGSFSIQIPNLNSNIEFEIYNCLGSLIKKETIQSEKTEVNLKQEPTGLYFVKVLLGNKIIATQKMIKQ